MSIDWITVAAQVANFLVLVWLLKRFLYRPILDGIDAREAEIADRMQAAVRAAEQAKVTEAEYHDKLANLQARQASESEAAHRKAQAERDALLTDAHDRIERERTAWQAHLDDEAQKFTTRLQAAGGHALLELTRKALADLADDTFEARVAAHLGDQIARMEIDLGQAAGRPDHAVFTSHGPLPDAIQADLTQALLRQFPGIDVAFHMDGTQAPGLTLTLGGAHLAWTVDSYIDGLDALMTTQVSAGADRRV